MTDWINKRVVYEGPIVRVSIGDIRLADGAVWPFDIVEHRGGVAVVPLAGDHVFLVRQRRPVVGENLLEIPAGKLESAGEDTVRRAGAELEEEVGFRAGQLIPVAEFFVSPGYCTERIVIYLGLDLEPSSAEPEATEAIERVALSLDEVRHMLDRGLFRDAKTIIGLRELLAYLSREGMG